MSDRARTSDLLARLQRHHIKPGPMPGGVFVPECGINGNVQTRADALYVGFTSTSGRILVGHEIKVSRADWRKELDTAGKADFWADNCHAWYVVAPSIEVVPPEELPHGWGLMVPNPRTTTRMDIKVKATVHPEREPSWQATRSILARLDTLRGSRELEVQRQADEKARAQADKRITERAERSLTTDQRNRLEALDRLEQALGVKLSRWRGSGDAVDPDHLAAALRLVLAADDLTPFDRWASTQLRQAADCFLAGLDEFETARTALAELAGKKAS
jgi:hypothetical protein